jgi:hypothetical protein
MTFSDPVKAAINLTLSCEKEMEVNEKMNNTVNVESIIFLVFKIKMHNQYK